MTTASSSGSQGQSRAPEPREIPLVTAVAMQIRERVRSDPTFTAELVARPRETLEAQGVPPEAVNDLIGPAGRLPRGTPDSAQEQSRCWLSIGCITTDNCFLSISACCYSGSC